ncbi:MAG: FecCD family ABC transporter permease [Crocinitomicaceae bacterium]
MRLTNKAILLLLLSVILLGLTVVSLGIGSSSLSLADVWSTLTGQPQANPTYEFIARNRLNRTLVALFAGSALSVAGLILQVFFRNPLAGPGVLGISSGAALGVALVVLGGLSLQGVSGYSLTILAGLTGAIGVLLLLLIMSKYIRQMVTLLVIGLMLSYFSSALLNVLYQWADNDATRAFVVWGLGSFEGLDPNELWPFIFIISIGILSSFSLVKPLNALSLGADYAQTLGINISLVRWQIILITGVLTAVVTVFCGPIGFLGMAVPQLSRQLAKSQNHLFIIPLTILIGASLALLADIFVRFLDGGVPLNTATSLIGAPIIIWAIFKMNRNSY